MTLDDWANLGEIVSGIGVVASLVYLSRQIRQNTVSLEDNARVVRAATANQVVERMAQTNMLTMSSREVADVWRRGLSGADLDPVDGARFLGFVVYLLRSCEAAHYQASLGVLDPARLEFAIGPTLRLSLQSPHARDYWSRARSLYPEPFRDYVDAIIAEAEHAEREGKTVYDIVYATSPGDRGAR